MVDYFFSLFISLSGIDASAQTSSHEMTIPNDVSASKSQFLTFKFSLHIQVDTFMKGICSLCSSLSIVNISVA